MRGLVLGPMFESALRQSLSISHGTATIFVTRPISAALLLCALLFVAVPGVRYLNTCLDPDPELLDAKNPRLSRAKARLEESGTTLGLHTLSAMNVAEGSPFLAEAADAYLGAAKAIGARWVIMHGGYHFTADKAKRVDLAVARPQRAAILLENMNPEPAGAEAKDLVHDPTEAIHYFERLTSPAIRWTYTTNPPTCCRYMQDYTTIDDMLKGREIVAALGETALAKG